MSELELLRAADDNFAVHAMAGVESVPGSAVRCDRGLTLVDSGLSSDALNVVCRARLAPVGAADRIRAAVTHFAAADRPFAWWAGPADSPADLPRLLTAAGLRESGSETVMAAELDRLAPARASADDFAVLRVNTRGRLDDFANLISAPGPGGADLARFFELAAAALLRSSCPRRFYVGYAGGRPVGTAEVCVESGLAGLYSVFVTPERRGRGIGSAMTVAPLLEAKAQGHATAILQAAPAAVRLYARIGFRSLGTVTEYKLAPIAPG